MGHGAGDGVVHHVEAGVPIDDDAVDGVLHHVADELLGLLDAVQHAVVPAVGAVLAGQVLPAAQHVHHPHGQVQLLGAGLAPGHVQAQALGLVLLIFGLELGLQAFQLLSGQFRVWLHCVLLSVFGRAWRGAALSGFDGVAFIPMPPSPQKGFRTRRAAGGGEKIPATAQFSADPERPRWREFMSWCS